MTGTRDTAAAIYKDILANPGDDLSRLALADALEERDSPGDVALSRFIKAQFAVEDIGPPRVEIDAVVTAHGPDYFTCSETNDEHLWKAGDRVDARDYSNSGYRGRRNREPFVGHGLLVTRVEPDDPYLGTVCLTLKRDDQSVPYPFETALGCARVMAETWKEVVALLPDDLPTPAFSTYWYPAYSAGPSWVRGLMREVNPRVWTLVGLGGPMDSHGRVGTAPTRYVPMVTYKRGLPSLVYSAWDAWTVAGKLFCERFPVRGVVLSDRPRWQWQHNHRIRMYQITWEGNQGEPLAVRPPCRMSQELFATFPEKDYRGSELSPFDRYLLTHMWPSVPAGGWWLRQPGEER